MNNAKYEYWEMDSWNSTSERPLVFSDLSTDDNICRNTSPKRNWHCNRPKGHSGPHEGGWTYTNGKITTSCGLWRNEDSPSDLKTSDLKTLWDESTVVQRRDMLQQDTFEEDLTDLSNKKWNKLPVIVQIKIFKKRMK